MTLREYTENLMDDMISEWHDYGPENQELYEFLGLTKDEYALYLNNPNEFFDYMDNK